MTDYELLCEILQTDYWVESLQSRSIAIKWSEDFEYFLLKYNQLASDFNDPIVRACRGIIFTKDKLCVCHPFDKFGNYGESYVPNMDWNTCYAQDKIDGSLMKAWYHNGWHLSTNGTIDAFSCEIGDTNMTFGKLFERAIAQSFDTWAENYLDKDYCYMFELTSPNNKIIIDYKEDKVWFLSRRNMKTQKEENHSLIVPKSTEVPKYHSVKNLDDCIQAASILTKDEEGYIIIDKNFNRIKVKSPAYLAAAHLANNGQISTKRIINMIKDLSIDDFLAYCGQHTERVTEIQNAINRITARWEEAWRVINMFNYYDPLNRSSRKEFAMNINKKYKDECSYLFAKLTNQQLTANEFLLSISANRIKDLVEKEIKYGK